MRPQTIFQDTIFALSSGAVPSGVGIVRISGPGAHDAAARLAGTLPPAGRAALRAVRDAGGQLIDRGIVLVFEAPRSFTGEDCVEIHVHGGKAVIAAVLDSLADMPALRHAEAGEFARRAFLNGKLDLTEVEALADLIQAETEVQRRLAIANAEGAQASLYGRWRRRLLHARAMLEAELDFSDEGDVPGSVAEEVWRDLAALHAEIGDHIDGYRAAEVIRDGFRVVLVGRPNAGKSSLINALSRRDVAIVTEVPGTTRDLVEAVLVLDGVKVIVVDTAGIRETDDRVERIGVDRAIDAARRADLVLELTEPGETGGSMDMFPNAPRLRVVTKADLIAAGSQIHGADHIVSSVTGAGLRLLTDDIARRAREAAGAAGSVLPSRLRHVSLLREGRGHLEHAVLSRDMDMELRAEELRLATKAFGGILGDIGTEDVLGAIFAEFCIGK